MEEIATVLKRPDGSEHLLLTDGQRHLQMEVTEGTLLEGPVRLHCTLKGLLDIESKVLSLRRLCLCRRLGRLPRTLYPPEPMAARWIEKLRAVDGAMAGATQREIAAALFGEERTAADWGCGSDCLRLRVQRLVRDGMRMVRGGYRDLLA